jgi:hypothetical protein
MELLFIEKHSRMSPVDRLPMLLAPSPSRDIRVQQSTKLQKMLKKETFTTGLFTRNELRSEVISWMYQINSSLFFQPETYYMSVAVFDRYISSTNIRIKKQFYYVALSCIYIIGKTVEELKEPKLQEMINLSKFDISSKKLKEMERKVLKELKWEIIHVTPWSLLDEVMLSVGYPNPRTNPKSRWTLIRTSLEKKLDPLLRKVIQNYEFARLPPSFLLRSCLDFLESRNDLVFTKLSQEVLNQLIPIDNVVNC